MSREENRYQTSSAVPRVGMWVLQGLQAMPSPLDFFFFLNNTVCSWNFLFGQYITMAMFCFVLKVREKMQSLPRASRWKSKSISENPSWLWKKTTLKPTFRNYCITGILFKCEILNMEKGQLKRTFPTRKKENFKKLGFLSSSNFKVQFVWWFHFSNTVQIKNIYKVFPDAASLL